MAQHIVLLPGDGIGPEITKATLPFLNWLKNDAKLDISWSEELIGGDAFDKTGSPFPDATLQACKSADAVLLACVGGPQWADTEYTKRPEAGLLALRKELQLYANLRPVMLFDALADASPIKSDIIRGIDIMIVRELTGGVYFGEPRGISETKDGWREGLNTHRYNTQEILRIGRIAFDLAEERKGRLCSVDKANVMDAGRLWREEMSRLQAEYPDVSLSHMYADNCAMQLIKAPRQFDVIVTDNLFGDMLSDEAAMLTGSLGMLPSASLGAADELTGKRMAVYEPIHGSAPDIAGKNVANPCAMILSLAMALRWSLQAPELADRLEGAVNAALVKGARTADLGASNDNALSTTAMAEAIYACL
jgi:3-isopropylmalate dehydrogenase